MSIPAKPVNAILVGAGNRGADVYGRFALGHPWLFRFTSVADPNDSRRTRFAADHSIPGDRCHADWNRLLDAAEPGDLVFICTPDRLHHQQALAFMDKGCSIVLEKPAAVTVGECSTLGHAAAAGKRRVVVCHVLRYTPFFSTLKEMLDEGRIGRVVSINLQENIGYYHFAHSYVRGNWRNSGQACPAILAKSCHDLDMLYWLAGSRAESVASIGELCWFKPGNAPEGAPARCLDGCPARSSCSWYAPDLYLTDDAGWPASTISDDPSLVARMAALETGPYGRCVYRCDNDVVDHQHVLVRFGNGVSASFVQSAFTADISRVIQVMGTEGEITGNLKQGWLELRSFLTGNRDRIRLDAPGTGHNGGDDALMNDIAALFGASPGEAGSRSRLEESLEGHWMAFAAETARTERSIVRMDEYRATFDARGASDG
jgi:predicted dehydrogenase